MTHLPDIHYAKSIDGVSLAYQVVGDGPVNIALLSFLGNQELLWELPRLAAFLERLAAFSRLVLHDQRGIGLSDRSPEGAPIEARVEDLQAVLEAAGCERTVLVGGMDGGISAALFAAAHPDLTEAFVWYAPTPRCAWAPDYPWGMTEEQLRQESSVVEAEWGSEASAHAWYGRDNPSLASEPEVVAWLAKMQRHSVTPGMARTMERIWYETDVRDVLPSIATPTLVIDRDGAVPEEGAYAASLIPGCERIVVHGDDCIIFLGNTDPIVDAIRRFVGAPRPVPDLDRVLATVLFTDVVASTVTVASLGDAAWKRLLDTHNDRVRRELQRFRGREIKPTGDGFLATFDGPARAVKCAQAICEVVKPLGLEVRAGCHTGEIELLGADVGGIAVHIGARVSALAGPSEVLVSSTVKDLVVGSGLLFEDRGEHELKGVPNTWHLYAVAQ